MSIELLVSKQNRDGGWPYIRGRSWTEPTVYAVLALLAAGETEPARKGLEWLRRRATAGWRLAAADRRRREHLGDRPGGASAAGALWAPRSTRAPSNGCWAPPARRPRLVYRIRQRLLGNRGRPSRSFRAGRGCRERPPGWDPPSLAILALEKEQRRSHPPAVRERIEDGQRVSAAPHVPGRRLEPRLVHAPWATSRVPIRKPPAWRWLPCAG